MEHLVLGLKEQMRQDNQIEDKHLRTARSILRILSCKSRVTVRRVCVLCVSVCLCVCDGGREVFWSSSDVEETAGK